jgi:endogenous inhibitor of DNA gyrase (YacG/DUF329 family)
MKPKVDFPRHSKSNQCLECRRQYNRVYKQLSRKGFCQQICRNVGIETWEQVDSVIRAMAESQYGIQKEYAALEKKITILKNDTEKVVEFDLCHQINYHSILMVFLKKVCQPGRATRRKFNFGSLRFCRGKLRVDLKVDYAGQRIGKP